MGALTDLLAFLDAGRPCALATVIECWGSAPEPVGARLAIAADGTFTGAVSGGCVEGDVIAEALALMDGARARGVERRYGISEDTAFSHGLACGGTIRILIQRAGEGGLGRAAIAALAEAEGDGPARVLETRLADFEARVRPAAPGEATGLSADGTVFRQLCAPPVRLVLVGAVEIARRLAGLAGPLGLAVTLVDPRPAFATAERFPGADIVPLWPDEALAARPLTEQMALVTLAHDPRLDDPALDAALASPAFHIAALGSRKTHAARLARLAARGHGPEALARIKGPAGLPIGAVGAGEIALSILAEIIARRRGAALAG
ncbi:MAG: XdhC family protein [Alphaproteobacteria bacterium]|nr:XdhC family protein [Alphaproteobacteria bacterium]